MHRQAHGYQLSARADAKDVVTGQQVARADDRVRLPVFDQAPHRLGREIAHRFEHRAGQDVPGHIRDPLADQAPQQTASVEQIAAVALDYHSVHFDTHPRGKQRPFEVKLLQADGEAGGAKKPGQSVGVCCLLIGIEPGHAAVQLGKSPSVVGDEPRPILVDGGDGVEQVGASYRQGRNSISREMQPPGSCAPTKLSGTANEK